MAKAQRASLEDLQEVTNCIISNRGALDEIRDQLQAVLLSHPQLLGRARQAGVESLHGVTVRVGMAEEDFERAFCFGHIRPV